MGNSTLNSQAFKLKGRLYTITVLSLVSTDSELFSKHLAEVIKQAPKLFNHTPLVLDCSEVNNNELDLQQFCHCLRQQGLIPVGVQGGNGLINTLAQGMGLAVLNASSSHDKPLSNTAETKAEPRKKPVKTKMLTNPVRSGQQVVSHGDLIITSTVSHGAELLADGHIHVYGALRGRALAGIDGNKNARIFCQSLEAELVSIAGYYRLSDAIDAVMGPCQIYLQDDHIQIESI